MMMMEMGMGRRRGGLGLLRNVDFLISFERAYRLFKCIITIRRILFGMIQV